MTAAAFPMHPILAVHISDGALTWPCLAGGFVSAGLLAAVAMIRVREEEIPRIALMTAAFFVASLIHVPVPPSSAHLLLNGLLGVVIGRRAPLAVLIGLMLQAFLLGHGGPTVIGVNTCVMALPALGAALLFGVLWRGTRWAWFRFALVLLSVALWLECLVYSGACLFLSLIVPWLTHSPVSQDVAWLGAAAVALNPIALAAVGLLSAAAAVLERQLRQPAEFPAGLLVGMAAVLATLALNTAALRFGGAADSPHVVLVLFAAHVPVMAVEAMVLGFAVGFLARVKPEMLGGFWGGDANRRPRAAAPQAAANGAVSTAAPARAVAPPPTLFLLAVLGLFATAGPAHAHRLDAGYAVRPDGQVQVESWFDIGGAPPSGARVQVLGPNGDELVKGTLDDQGIFVFRPPEVEDLKVVVSAGGGHRAEFTIPASALLQPPAAKPTPSADKAETPSPAPPQAPADAASPGPASEQPKPMLDHESPTPYKEIVTGLAFLFGLAGFVLGLLNLRELRALRKELAARAALDADHFSAGKTSSSGTSH